MGRITRCMDADLVISFKVFVNGSPSRVGPVARARKIDTELIWNGPVQVYEVPKLGGSRDIGDDKWQAYISLSISEFKNAILQKIIGGYLTRRCSGWSAHSRKRARCAIMAAGA